MPDEKVLTQEETERINQVLEAFLHNVSPETIGKFQETHSYVWITLIPFLQLALSGPGKRRQTAFIGDAQSKKGNHESPKNLRCDSKLCDATDDGQCKEVGSCKSHENPNKFSPAEKIGLFCLCHLVTAEENRKLFRKEKILDYLICVQWFAKKCPEVNELIPNLEGFHHHEPPRLESIAKAYLSKCFGHKIMCVSR